MIGTSLASVHAAQVCQQTANFQTTSMSRAIITVHSACSWPSVDTQEKILISDRNKRARLHLIQRQSTQAPCSQGRGERWRRSPRQSPTNSYKRQWPNHRYDERTYTWKLDEVWVEPGSFEAEMSARKWLGIHVIITQSTGYLNGAQLADDVSYNLLCIIWVSKSPAPVSGQR